MPGSKKLLQIELPRKIRFAQSLRGNSLMSTNKRTRGSLDGEIIKIRRGLAIYKVHASPYWMCRILDTKNKKYVVRSTKEQSRINARQAAEEFALELFGPGKMQGVPPDFQFQHFSNLLLDEAQRDVQQERRAKTYVKDLRKVLDNKKHGLIKEFGKRDVREITTRDFTSFVRKLNKDENSLSASSHNQIRTVFRRVLKVALLEGAIHSIPEAPKLNNSKPSSRTFFRFYPLVPKDRDDYKTLLKVSSELAEESVKVRGIPITEELRDIILFTVHSFIRPTYSELYALRHQDITIREDPKRLQLTIHNGKTGARTIDTMEAPVEVYKRIRDRNKSHLKNDDYIFLPQYKNRDTAKRIIMRQFNYLLERSGLKKDPYTGHTHSMYSLRHTCLCMRLVLSEGNVNIYALANNSGTSVEMLQNFYLKTLPATPEVARNLQSFGKEKHKQN